MWFTTNFVAWNKIVSFCGASFGQTRQSLSWGLQNLACLLNFLIELSFVACLKFQMNWQQGYAPPNSDRREGVLRRKRLEYLDCVSQYYDIPDSDRSDDEINMLRQVFSMLKDSPSEYHWSLVPNINTFPTVDFCGLSTNCTWCLFLPANTSSEILGAHPLYMVRFYCYLPTVFVCHKICACKVNKWMHQSCQTKLAELKEKGFNCCFEYFSK